MSGITDVDAITLSMVNMSKTLQELDIASYAIMIAVFMNTAFKSILTWVVGNRWLAVRVAGSSLVAILTGLCFI